MKTKHEKLIKAHRKGAQIGCRPMGSKGVFCHIENPLWAFNSQEYAILEQAPKRLQPGMTVEIVGPSKKSRMKSPGWLDDLDAYIGDRFILPDPDGDGHYKYKRFYCLHKWLKVVEEKLWPKMDEKVWYHHFDGVIDSAPFGPSWQAALESGALFPTMQAAEDEWHWLSTMRELRRLAKEYNDGWVPDFNSSDQHKYAPVEEGGHIDIVNAKYTNRCVGLPCLKSTELLDRAIKEIGEANIIRALEYMGGGG